MKKLGAIALVLVVIGYVSMVVYGTYHAIAHPNPKAVAYVRTPVRWGDVGLGFILGAGAAMMGSLLVITWPLRRGEGPGGDGGSKRTIAVPMMGKVISIEDFKRMPTQGPVQLSGTGG